MMALQSERIK